MTDSDARHDYLLTWLKDAYAMELQATELLERQIQRIEHYPELSARIRQHLEETKWQATQLEDCLRLLGEDDSTFKNMMGKLSATLTALGTAFASDEIIKASAASAVFERYEIANYTILIAAAKAAGETEVARICTEIVRQEVEMAEWLDAHLADTVMQFLLREEAGVKAKV